jgi:hypothetical protein
MVRGRGRGGCASGLQVGKFRAYCIRDDRARVCKRRSARPSSTRGCSADFQTLNVFVNLRLQLPELLPRPFRE